MDSRKATAILAALVFAAGLAAGLWPLKLGAAQRTSDGEQVACGSAFRPDSFQAHLDDIVGDAFDSGGGREAGCEDALSDRRTIATIVVAIGGLGLLYIALTAKREIVVDDDGDSRAQRFIRRFQRDTDD